MAARNRSPLFLSVMFGLVAVGTAIMWWARSRAPGRVVYRAARGVTGIAFRDKSADGRFWLWVERHAAEFGEEYRYVVFDNVRRVVTDSFPVAQRQARWDRKHLTAYLTHDGRRKWHRRTRCGRTTPNSVRRALMSRIMKESDGWEVDDDLTTSPDGRAVVARALRTTSGTPRVVRVHLRGWGVPLIVRGKRTQPCVVVTAPAAGWLVRIPCVCSYWWGGKGHCLYFTRGNTLYELDLPGDGSSRRQTRREGPAGPS